MCQGIYPRVICSTLKWKSLFSGFCCCYCFIFSMCMYVLEGAYVTCLHVYGHICICMCYVWCPEADVRYLSRPLCFIYWHRVSHWAQSLLIRTVCLSSLLWIFCHCFPSSIGSQVPHPPGFSMSSGDLRVISLLRLAQQPFIYGANSLDTPFLGGIVSLNFSYLALIL